MVIGLVIAYAISAIRVKREGLDTDYLLIIGAVTLGFALIGAKLLYLAVTFTPAELAALIRKGQFNALMVEGWCSTVD